MRKLALLAASLSTFGLVQLAGAAGSASDNLGVSATVSTSCTITGSTLGFGAYNIFTLAQVDSTALVAVACTNGTAATIALGEGANPGATSSPAIPVRRMNDGGTNFLSYSLWSNALRTTVWGNTVATSVSYDATSSTPTNLTVYGRIASGQDVPAGSYADTVLATIAF